MYNGNQTLAAQQAAMQNKLGIAGLTGKYEGADTIQGQTLAHTLAQDDKEYAQNSKFNIINSIQNLKNSGYNETQIQSLFHNMGIDNLGIPGVDTKSMFGNAGLTSRPPMIMPTGSGLGATNKAVQANKANGYTTAEMHQAGINIS